MRRVPWKRMSCLVLAVALCAALPASSPIVPPAAAAPGVARNSAPPPERPLPAGAGERSGAVPPVPPAVPAGGPVRKLSPEERAARAPTPQVLEAPTDVVLRAGFLLGDVSLVAYFNADLDEDDPTSWTEWWATVADEETGDEQRSAVLGRDDLARCATPRPFCRSFGTADGWTLEEGRRYTATVTVRRPDGTEETSAPSAPARARRTASPPAMPPAQASGCACPNALGPTVAAQELRGALVNTATGAFIRSERDLGMPAPGIPFEAIRFYSSANPTAGMFGPGWTWTYDMRVVASDDGAVRVRAEDGAEAVYQGKGDGSFDRPPGVRSKLSRAAGGWQLVPPDQRRIRFDDTGRLRSVTDARGEGVTMTYDGAGALTAITDAAGRVVTVEQRPENRLIERLTLPDGRTVSFGYDGGRLTSVVDARGFTWRYTYDGDGRLTEVLDPRGIPDVRNTYSAGGRVVEQRDALDAVTAFAWDRDRQEARTTDPDGVVTLDGYKDNVLVYSQNGNGDSVNHRYDERLRRRLLVDPKGNQEETAHDDDGNPITRTSPEPFNFTETNEFDGRNNLLRHTDGRANNWSYSYNEQNEMTGQSDPEQEDEGYRYERDGRGLVIARTDPRGKVTRYEHDAAGNRIAAISPTGRRTEFDHDITGRLTCVIDPRGTLLPGGGHQHERFHTRFRYDEQDRLIERRDAGKQGSYLYEHDEVGNVVAHRDPLGNVTRYRYDAANRLVEKTDPKGNVTAFTFTPAGRRTSMTDPEGNTTSWTYDARGRVRSETSPRGNADGGAERERFTTTYDYDFNGNPVRASRPLPGGGRAQIDTEFDELNRPVSQVDELGNTTRMGYDDTHNLTSMTDEHGSKLGMTHDRAGRRTASTDADGRPGTGITYDRAGNPLRQTSATGGVTSYAYDDDGRIVAITEPRGNEPGADPAAFTTRIAYDPAGNPESVTDPLGNVTRFVHDESNRTVAEIDANGHTTRYRYDEADRLVAVVGPDADERAGGGPDAAATTYAYDANGLAVERVDPLGRRTTTEYDRADRAVRTVDALNRERRFVYDPDDNVVELVTAGDDDPAARTITSSYDSLNRLAEKRIGPDGPRYSFGYDAKNRLVSVADPTGERTHEFDASGRLTAVARGDERFTYAYDRSDNLIRRTYPDGTSIEATFDAGDRVTSLTAAKGGGSRARFELGYDAADNLIRTTYPAATGIVAEQSFDPAGRLTGIASRRGADVVAGYDLELDAVGNPTRVTTTRGGPGQPSVTEATAYEYDPANRITAACYGALTCAGPAAERLDYAYDLVGNRTRQGRTSPAGNAAITYEYDAADQLRREVTSPLTAGPGPSERTFDYDGEGNQIRAGADTYRYHLDHTLASARVGGQETSYAYDGDGNLLTATTGAGRDATERRWAWDMNARLPMLATETETAGDRTERRSFVHGTLGQPLALLVPAGEGSEAHPYLHDWLNGVGGLTGPDGTPEWTYDYEPFGAPRGEGLDRGGRRLTDESPQNPLQFAGGYADGTQGGRYQLRARNYDPVTGRFDSTDPKAAPAHDPAASPYAYAGNRPTVTTDPSGMLIPGGYGRGSTVSSPSGSSRADQRSGDGDDDSEEDPYAQQRESARKKVRQADAAVKRIGDEVIDLILDLVGYQDAKRCVSDGDIVACVSTVLGAVPWGKALKAAKVAIKAIGVGKRLVEAYGRLRSARSALEDIPDVARRVRDGARKAANTAADVGRKATRTTKRAASRVRETARKVTDKVRRRDPCNSFPAGTRVVMADGSTKPIESVAPGDVVRATDPRTGATTAQPVRAAIAGPGTDARQLVDLTLVGAGAGGGGPPLTATDGHLFWVVDRGWVPAGRLAPGDRLADQQGGTVTVAATAHRTAAVPVHDLTVAGVPTFAVVDGEAHVLVHNQDCGQLRRRAAALQRSRKRAFDRQRGTTSAVRVRNADTDDEFTLVTTNGIKEDQGIIGALGDDEVYVTGPGHAEETAFAFVDAMRFRGMNVGIVAGGTSRGVCIPCRSIIRRHGLDTGGPVFPARLPNTPHREFGRPGFDG